MNIVRRDVIDWEPLILTMISSGIIPGLRMKIQRFVQNWSDRRNRAALCKCRLKYFNILELEREMEAQVHVEWMCDVCIGSFIADLEKEFPGLGRLEIGTSGLKERPDSSYIFIPERVVEFENGDTAQVSPFFIRQCAVSIGEIEEFVAATGYRTMAERAGEMESFRSHHGLSGISGDARRNSPATYISYLDASEFCRWSELRLPSEAEFLAAAIIDPKPSPPISEEQLERLRELLRDGKALMIGGPNLTSSFCDDSIVLRSGPKHFLTNDWRLKVSRNRLCRPKDYYDVITEFHVCKEAEFGRGNYK